MYRRNSELVKFLKSKININRFLLGVTIFSTAAILDASFSNNSLVSIIYFLAIALIVFYGYKLLIFDKEDRYLNITLTCLLLWNCFVILHGITFTYLDIRKYLTFQYHFWPFLVPLAAKFKKSDILFKQIFVWAYFSGLFYLFLSPVLLGAATSNLAVEELSAWSYVCGCGLILLTWNYHSSFRRWISVIAVFVGLFVMTILARRGIMLTLANFLFFGYLLYFIYYSKGKALLKVISILSFVFIYLIGISYYNAKKESSFKLIASRATENTRDQVFTYFFADMGNDWFIGKGMNGTYYCPIRSDDNQEVTDYRDVIECGYLQIILKGGIINLILYLLLFIPAIYKGFFKSKNGLSKALALIIFLWMVDMVPFGLPVLGLRYLLVWIAVGVCYSRKIRSIPEAEMQSVFLTRRTVQAAKLSDDL